MAEPNEKCSDLNHGPWENLPLGGMRCEKCFITPLGAWKEARNEVASLRARIAELEQDVAKSECDYWELHSGLTARISEQSDVIREVSRIVGHVRGLATLAQAVALANSERLTNEAINAAARDAVDRLLALGDVQMGHVAIVRNVLIATFRAARGAKEKA